MARTHFYHVVTRKNISTGELEPLADFLATAYHVDDSGTETTLATIFLGRTGLTTATGLSTANGVISFWLDDGDYNVHIADTTGPARLSAFQVGVSAISGAAYQAALQATIDALALLESRATALELTSYKTGDIKVTTNEFTEAGWVVCMGQIVNRATYADLFDVIGETFGPGDGSTTFELPNLSNRVPLGTSVAGSDHTYPGVTTALGFADGEMEHSLIEAEIPTHVHASGVASGGFVEYTGATTANMAFASGALTHFELGADATAATGGGGSHNNMQPYIGLVFKIKT